MLVVRKAFQATMFFGALALGIGPAHAADVYVQLLPLSGEIRLRNKDVNPLPVAFYEIDSSSGALNGSASVWKSIAGTYDLTGNGFIDPTHNWIKISSGPTSLTEGVISGSGGALPAQRAISLGKIWN